MSNDSNHVPAIKLYHHRLHVSRCAKFEDWSNQAKEEESWYDSDDDGNHHPYMEIVQMYLPSTKSFNCEVESNRSQNERIWKFGYGSNISLENLRLKKGLDPKAAKR